MSELEDLRWALRERTTELALEQAARLRAEESLVRTQHLEHIGRLTAGIAHDLNNLLLVALMHADMLTDESIGLEGRESEVVQLHGVLTRAANLTTRVMAVARGDDGPVRELDVRSLLQDVTPVVRRLVGRGIDVHIEAEPALWQVRGDTTQIEQVLLNLCANARDAMPTGGRLAVLARNRSLTNSELRREFDPPIGDYLELEVCDTGTGMSEDVRRRLFEPFFTTKAPGQGTGLGLASSLGLVRRLGGTIMVESEPGVGSTFRVLLPRAQRAPIWPLQNQSAYIG